MMMMNPILLIIVTFLSTTEAAMDMTKAVVDLTAGDPRLVRYDATEGTTAKQIELCDSVMPEAIQILSNNKKKNDMMIPSIQALVLCITDVPKNRETFANAKGIHNTLLKHLETAVKQSDDRTIASIGNLIWISTYGNAKNHQGFAPAVKPLAQAFLLQNIQPVARMWTAAALQNLAASYCHNPEDPDDPGCYWDYQNDTDEHVSINKEESGDMFIDATSVRLAMLKTPGLVDALSEWACKGPFSGHATEENPSAALNAVVASAMLDPALPKHEDHENIVPWAAIGALKNLALLKDAKSALAPHEACFCRLSQSYDWLEHTKSSDLLGFIRPSFPCWFNWDPEDVEPKDVPLCVDHMFRDAEGNTCFDYDYSATTEECTTVDAKRSDVTANDACCGCGGGNNVNMPVAPSDVEADEL